LRALSLAEILTKYLPKTSLMHYHCTNMLSAIIVHEVSISLTHSRHDVKYHHWDISDGIKIILSFTKTFQLVSVISISVLHRVFIVTYLEKTLNA